MRLGQPLRWLIFLVLALSLVACGQAITPTPAPTKPASAPAASPAKPAATAPAAASPAKPIAPSASPSAAAPKAEVKPLNPPVKVSFGTITTLGGMSYFLANENGYFKDEGLDVEFVTFKTGGDMIPALSRGDVDAGSGAINAGLFNAVARDITVQFVGEASNVQRTESISVRADLANDIKELKDLKGHKIALSATAGSPEILLDAALKKGGLTQKDVEVVTLGFPDMLAALANKAIDVAIITEPTTTQGVEQGVLSRWILAEQILTHQTGALMYSSKFIQEKNEAAKRLMVAIVRGARDYYEFTQTGKDKDKMIAVATKYTNVKDRKVYEDMIWTGIDPDQAVKRDSIANDLNWYVEKGYVKPGLSVDKVIDNSFTQYALERLGPAKR